MTKSFTFKKAFSQKPIVVGGVMDGSTYFPITEVNAQVVDVTTTGCTIVVQNVESTSFDPDVAYIAVGVD